MAPTTRRQRFSKRAFNSAHRVDVAVAVYENPFAQTKDFCAATGVPQPSVHTELQVLHEMGVVQRLEVGREVRYGPIEGSFWTWVREVHAATAEDVRSGDGQLVHDDR